jgi:hypothetical protein
MPYVPRRWSSSPDDSPVFTHKQFAILAVVVAGALLLFAGIDSWRLFNDWRVQDHGAQTSALIADASTSETEVRGHDSFTTYLTLRFATASGRRVVTTVTLPGEPNYSEGDEVAIRYDRANPRDAELVGHGSGSWALLLELLAGLIACVALAVYLGRRALRDSAAARSRAVQAEREDD